MFSLLVPPCGLLLAHWFLGETLHAHMLVGLSLVLAGLVCILWRRSQSPLRRHVVSRLTARGQITAERS
jgi:drug/metabolite transporter (DMT)-like permease